MRQRPTPRFPWATLLLLLIFLALAWLNFAPALRQEWYRLERRLKQRQSRLTISQQTSTPRSITAPTLDLSLGVASNETAFTTDERNTIAIYRAVSPSVVTVVNRTYVRDLFSWELREVPQGTGSGFVWDAAGHIISNFHVVQQARAITVIFSDGTSFPARVVGVAPDYDLAVLQIEAPAERLVPVHCGTSRDLQVGQTVLAIGNPFGFDTTLTVGVVSALGRSITSVTERKINDMIQTDAAINPGNSGGPLLNSRGQLIGVNTAIFSPSGAYAGIGFAVPADTVARVVPQLIVRGKVSRAGLGVQLLPDHAATRFGMQGAVIFNVLQGSSADRAGLRGLRQTLDGRPLLGDVIVSFDGRPVATVEDLFRELDQRQPGEVVLLGCLRDSQRRELEVTLQEVE